MRIEAMDTGDAGSVDAVVGLLEAAHTHDFPRDPKFCPSWERGRIVHPVPDGKHEWWLARSGDAVDAVMALELPTFDNVTTALVEITVHPRARRRGIGSALLDRAKARALAGGRKLLITWSDLGGGTEAFARHSGFEIGLTEHRQLLTITPERHEQWAALLADARPYADGYTVVRWRNETPPEYAGGLAYLNARMSTDAPLGELQWEAEAWDAERVRAKDQAMAAWGRRTYTTAAIRDASGEMAGYTTLAYAVEDPTHAWQWNTIVGPEHRGHRLGTLLKVANHQFTFAAEPETRTVFTWNAESNTHMNAINTALGFAPIDRWAESQQQLS